MFQFTKCFKFTDTEHLPASVQLKVAENSAKNGDKPANTKEGMSLETQLLTYGGGIFGGLVLIVVVGVFIKGRLNKNKRDNFLRKPYEEN